MSSNDIREIPSSGQGNFTHIVFFWLKKKNNKEDHKVFESSLIKFLKSSKYIKTMHVGRPADTNREVIDSTYSYCLSLTFANEEDQAAYQEEKVHKIFIEESSNLWEKVVVYDSENILK